MGKSIVSKGTTIEEAIDTALHLLDALIDEIDIEVIETEKKGWMGLGSKPAVIRATLRDSLTESSKEEIKQPVDSLDLLATVPEADGKVWVKDGQIFCKNALDKYPRLSPGEGMKLFCNHKIVESTVVVGENDVLKVELEDEGKESSWELIMDDKMMKITLTITPGMRIYRQLMDQDPDTHIQLKIKERHEPCPIEINEVLEKLKGMKGAVGVNYSEISRLCQGKEKGSFLIASGIKPVPGKSGYFVPLKELTIKRGVKERLDGTVDHREIQEFPSVEPGQVIGVIHPPIPGKPGTSVVGEPVLPPEVYPLVVQEGKGVALTEDGTKVIATEMGQPQIVTKGQFVQISVVSKLDIRNDVSLETGNVHFVGDVEIHGSVQDGMLIEANGNIQVHDNVNMAQVKAGNSVIVHHNIISSEVIAGTHTKLIKDLVQLTEEIVDQIKLMVQGIQQLNVVSTSKVANFTQIDLGPLITMLCDSRFKSFRSQTASLIRLIDSGKDDLDTEWIVIGERLKSGFMISTTSDLKSEEQMVQLVRTMETILENNSLFLEGMNCFMKVSFSHNSQLYSAGDLLIVGQGSYNSKLYADGFIQIDGYVRGGEIYAAKGVKINEAGTKGGAVTKIIVPIGQIIEINRVMEDTVIQIGLKSYKFDQETTLISARLNEAGQIYFQ